MKIWFIEIGEPLPVEKDARLFRYGLFTRELANRYGHDVTWWTSGFSHFKRQHVLREDTVLKKDKVNLNIIKGIGYKSSVSFKRIRHQIDFASKLCRRLSENKNKPDILICSVPTIENAYCAVKTGRMFGVPVLIDIRDEWPDEFVDLAPKFLRPIAKLILFRYYRKMDFICKNATGLIAMSKRQHDYAFGFAKREFNKNDGIFPHGYPSQNHTELSFNDRQWWINRGVDETKLICCFFGTIGNYFNLDTVFESAAALGKSIPVQFVLCGSGQKFNYYLKQSEKADNIILPGFVDKKKISALMDMADIGLAPYAQGTKMSMPNKVFEYMAGGLPLVSSIKGEITQILKKYHCGITYDAGSTEQLTFVIQKLYDHPDLRKQMGKNAKKIFFERFTTEKIVEKFNDHICNVVGNYNRS